MSGVVKPFGRPAFTFEEMQRLFPRSPVSRPPVTPKMPPQPITPNRYTRTRIRPINQPRGPFQPRPDLGRPDVGFGPGLPQNPPPSFVTPPPEGSLNAQVLTPITNPVTGETYTAPTGGYTLNPNLQPGGPFVGRPDLGRPDVGFGPGLPQPQLEAMPYTDSTAPMPQSGMPGGKSFANQQQPMTSAAGTPPGFVPSWQMAGYNSLDEWRAATGGANPNASIGMPGGPGFNPMAGNTTLPGSF